MASPAANVAASQQSVPLATGDGGGLVAGGVQAASASALITLAGAVQVEGKSRMEDKLSLSALWQKDPGSKYWLDPGASVLSSSYPR